MSDRLKLDNYLPYRLSIASNQVSNLIASLYQDRFGLSIWQWRVLAMLGASGSLTAQQVASNAAMDKMTVSRAVSGLLKRDLIVRKADLKDRRAQILSLSDTGRKIHDEIAPLAIEQEKVLLAGMSKEEIERLFLVLEHLEKTAIAINSKSDLAG
ncbi:MAG: winged helix-turn-helix transcriptional regulator [Robiginitomaculum sp.]|nr:winged helix-turn-helix transcriptional regulator [Robiginitomaculum sp.]